jgi:hypothetical protein
VRVANQSDNTTLAWLPHTMDLITTRDDRRRIVGAAGNHLYIYTLEGTPMKGSPAKDQGSDVCQPQQIAVAQAGVLGADEEPVYNGKSLGAWLTDLHDQRQHVRREAINALRQMHPPQAAVPSLIAAVNDGDDHVRFHAVYTLGDVGPSARWAVRTLLQTLQRSVKENDGDMRAAVLRALGKIAPDNAELLPALIEAAKSPDFMVRLASVETFGEIGTRASPALESLENLAANDRYEEIRKPALAAIQKISGSAAS